MRIAILISTLLLLAACKPNDETRFKIIIGATLIDGTGGPPISRSVVVVAGTRIRSAGSQASTPVPAGSDKFDGRGKFIVPLPVTVADVSSLPVAITLADARKRIEDGANALAGMIGDTEEIEGSWVSRARNLQVVFFPRLASLSGGEALDRARRNTKKLASQGVHIGATGESPAREWQLMAEAGLSPMDVVLASTRNVAIALRKQEAMGSIVAGRSADLIMLTANPLDDPRNLDKVDRIMKGGEWVEK